MRTASMLLVLSFFTTLPIYGQESGMPQKVRDQANRKLIGDWTFDFEYRGQPGKGTYSLRWSPGKESIIGHQTYTTAQAQFHVTVLIGWDAASQSIVIQYFSTNGDHLTMRCPSISDNMWSGRIAGTYQGEKIEGTAKLVLGDGRLEYESVVNNNQIYKSVFAPAKFDKIPEELRTTLDRHYVGRWKSEINYGGEKIVAETEARWSLERAAIVAESTVSAEKVSRVAGLVGWDPARRAIVHTGYGDDGSQFVIHWTRFAADRWDGTISGIYNGRTYDGAPAKVLWGNDVIEYEDLTLGVPWKETLRRQK